MEKTAEAAIYKGKAARTANSSRNSTPLLTHRNELPFKSMSIMCFNPLMYTVNLLHTQNTYRVSDNNAMHRSYHHHYTHIPTHITIKMHSRKSKSTSELMGFMRVYALMATALGRPFAALSTTAPCAY